MMTKARYFVLGAALVLLIAATPVAFRISVMTDSTGAVTSPTNFWDANSVTRLGPSIDLGTEVTGNLPVSRLDGGEGANLGTYWRGDGTWAAPVGIDGAGVTDGAKGDVIVSTGGQVWTIVDGAITGTKMESVGVNPGVYQNATLTVDAKGRVIAVQSGTGADGVNTAADYDWTGRHSFSEVETEEVNATQLITPSFTVSQLRIGTATLTNALAIASGGTGSPTRDGARQNLGLVPGEDVQPFSPALSVLDQAGYVGTGPFVRQSVSGSGGGGFTETGTQVTTDASATTLWSATIPANSAVEYYAELISGGPTNIAGYRIAATMGNRAGVGSTVEVETIKESETTAGMSAAFSRSGTTASLVVQGVAGENIRWDWGLSYRVVALATGGGDTTPPTLESATVSVDGLSLVLVFDEPVVIGPSQDGGLMLNVGAEQIGIGFPPGSATGYGTDTLTYPLGRTIRFGEVLVFGYNQPGGAITDIAGTDLANITDFAVTNNSMVDPPSGECGATFASYTGTINGSTALAYSWNRAYVAQRFIAPETGSICGADLQFIARLGSPTYGMRVEIWTHDATTNRPDQKLGISSNSVLASEVSATDPTWISFEAMAASVTQGTQYWVVLVADGLGDLSNYVSWSRYSAILDDSIVFGGGTGNWTVSSSSRISNVILYTTNE